MQRWIDRLSIGFLLIVFGVGMPLLWAAQSQESGQMLVQTAEWSPPASPKDGTAGHNPTMAPDSKLMILVSTQNP